MAPRLLRGRWQVLQIAGEIKEHRVQVAGAQSLAGRRGARTVNERSLFWHQVHKGHGVAGVLDEVPDLHRPAEDGGNLKELVCQRRDSAGGACS